MWVLILNCKCSLPGLKSNKCHFSWFHTPLLSVSLLYTVGSFLSSTGAAVVVDTILVPDAYSRLLFNPLCFILYENSSQSPEQWENVSYKRTIHAYNYIHA